MRIRSTKPEFYRSTRVAKLSWDARYVLKGLEAYVDDNGVGKDSLALIVADVFPHDIDMQLHVNDMQVPAVYKRVAAAIKEIENIGFIHRYETNSEKYIYLSWWENTQYIARPKKGRYPRPDGTLEYGDSTIGAPQHVNNMRLHADYMPGTGEQGTGEQGTEHTVQPPAVEPENKKPERQNYPKDFEKFWEIYPRRESKKDAFAAFKAAKKNISLETILNGAQRYLKDPNRKPQYTKLPATWLRAGGWDDEPLPPRDDPSSTSHMHTVDRNAYAAWGKTPPGANQ